MKQSDQHPLNLFFKVISVTLMSATLCNTALGMQSAQFLGMDAVDSDSVSPSTWHANELYTDQSSYLSIMTPAQQHSYQLLIRRFHLKNQKECFIFAVNKVSHSTVPFEYQLKIYEKHNIQCGGDPNTQPLRAVYYIDIFGRIFKDNIPDATIDFQYKYNETPNIITDIQSFNHPTKTVFEQHGIELYKLEKRADDTFVIFYVSQIPRAIQKSLFNSLLTANGGWDFVIRSDNGSEYYIEGDKRKVIDTTSYLN